MQPARFLECLAADAARLREVAGRDLDAAVPSCPGWTSADLVRHTALVYLHKVECMRRSAFPKDWPPAGIDDEPPLALFDRAYDELVAEFEKRDPEDETVTWYAPDQTVGFWIRRMAQETVIHRVDAELAQNEQTVRIPADLAIDGTDEVLVCFLGYMSATYKDAFKGLEDGEPVLIAANEHSWIARPTPDGVAVAPGGGDAVATVSGEPEAVLLWLWRRASDDAVAIEGDAASVGKLRDLLEAATQ